MPATRFNRIIFFVGVGLLSGTVLGFEVLLLRLFTLMYGHHFASMVISLALLGLGAGGILLRLGRPWLQTRWTVAMVCTSFLFALALPSSLFLAQSVHFNPLEMVWAARQWIALWALYGCFSLPFFFAGLGLGLALTSAPFQIKRVYAADLAGAAFGAGLTLLSLYRLPPEQALLGLSLCALLASACFGLALLRIGQGLGLWLCLGCAALVLLQPGFRPRPELSQYKSLSKTLLLPGTEIIEQEESPFGRLSLVRSPRIPFRFAPGLSYQCEASLPDQLGIFLDGDRLGVINLSSPTPLKQGISDCLPTAAVYHLLQQPRVCCNRAGQGMGILEGLEHGARSIVGVQSHPGLIRLLQSPEHNVPAAIYNRPEVHLVKGSVRSSLLRSEESFDCIRLWSPGGRGGSLRAQPLRETFDFTVQAFSTYLDHLNPEGLLLVAHWINPLWTETAKILTTIKQACLDRSLSNQDCGLALILSQSTVVILMKKGGLTGPDRSSLREFTSKRGFELLLFEPGRVKDKASSIPRDTLKTMRNLVLGGDSKPLERFKFQVRPATDASPYFNYFFSWRSFPELWQLRSQGGASLVQWGYLILTATLAQALAAGGLLILLPLIWRPRASSKPALSRTSLYFTCLGLAFLFLEIALMQRMILFLGQPILAVTLVLVAVLLAGGLGSLQAGRIRLLPSVAAIVLFCLAAVLLLPELMKLGMNWPEPLRIGLVMILSGLPAFFMGIPFPAGLEKLRSEALSWTPWAWAVNACASVVSPLLATLICLHAGFNWLLTASAGLYILAWFAQARGFARPT